jgi:hypothetical protein
MRGARIRAAILIASLTWSCGQHSIFIAEPPPADARSMILAFVPRGGSVSLHAADPAGRASIFTAMKPVDVDATVLYFAETLDELQLAPGPIASPQPGTGGRSIPPFVAAYAAHVSEGGSSMWSPTSDVDPAILGVQLPALDLERCAAEGGCAPADRSPSVCTIPCPARSPIALPQFLPCPSGWITDGARCEPPALPALLACPEGQAQRAQDSTCTPIGSPCPAGAYSMGLPGGVRTVFVDPAASPGGRGTIASPFRTIAAATATATPGTMIALAKGRYTESVVLHSGVTLFGACATETIIETSTGAPNGIFVDGRGATIQELTVTGALDDIYVAPEASGLRVENVLAKSATGSCLVNLGSETTVVGSVLRGCRQAGLWAAGGLIVNRSVIEDNTGIGLQIGGLGATQIAQTIIRGTKTSTSGGSCGLCIVGGMAVANEVVIAATDGDAMVIQGASSFVAEGIRIHGTAGAAMLITDKVTTIVRTLEIDGASGNGMLVDNFSGTASISDAFLHGFLDNPVHPSGIAINSGTVHLQRVVIRGAVHVGIYSDGPATIVASDLEVASSTGSAIYLSHNASAVVSRASFDANGSNALDVEHGAQLTATDITASRCTGACINSALFPQRVSVRRFRVHDAYIGAATAGASALDLHDGEISSCAIGARISSPTDARSLLDQVAFIGNQTQFQHD